MKILLLCDNYPPEMNANARIFSELAEAWAHEGEDVQVITSHPNFPQGKIYPGYKNNWLDKQKINNVNVSRVKTYIYANMGVFRRTLDFLSFGLSSFFCGLFQKNIDIIVGVSPQFFSAVSACCLALLKRKPFVMILCDLWPDSIISNEVLSKNWLYSVIKKMELWLYKKAQCIVILSEYFRGYLINHKIPNEKIFTSISGASDAFYPREKNKNLEEQHSLNNKFVVGLIGTFGISHNHEDILSVALSMKNKHHDNIHYLMVGAGTKKENLLAIKDSENLCNVKILGPFPAETIPEYWSLCDVALVLLSDTVTNTTVLPSKMLEAMSMGLPILLYAPQGEASRFLNLSNSGWHIPVGNKKGLEEMLFSLSENNGLIKEHAEKALLFSKKFSRNTQAMELLQKFKKIQKVKVKHENI